MSPEDLGSAVSVQLVRDTQLIRVQARDSNPQGAVQIADTLVAVFAEQRQTRQSSRFAASKENLQSQMAILEEQILQAEARLSGLGNSVEERTVRDRLETAVAQYRQS